MNIFCVSTALAVILPIIGLIVGAAVGIVVYILVSKKKVGTANQQAAKIINEAIEKAQTLTKEATLKSKEEILKQRDDFEQEIKNRRGELTRSEQRLAQSEQRLAQKEDVLDKKEQTLDQKLETIEKTKEELVQKKAEVNDLKAKVEEEYNKAVKEVEKVASMTRDEAKKILMSQLEDEAKKDALKTVKAIESEAKEEGRKKAQEIIATAIQRCAVDHAAEITVSVVNLPNDEMKGRIIGREGRNIRALENATGVDLIIDDTPEAVVLSGFDPVRREVARITLEKLIADGRIHPGRIEEIVEKTRKELDVQIKEAGENATYETGVIGIHPDLVRLLGRLKYRTSYGQNVLKHSVEVSHLAGLMAAELGADVNLAKRGGLLHDIGKAIDHEVEGTHITIGADLAKKYRENKEVIHCIAAHHNDIEPQTLEAILVQCADAISGSRPGARRESLDSYVKRLEKLESIANGFEGVEKSYAIQAGREVRIIVKPEMVDDAKTVFMAKEIARQIETDMEYPGQIKVNVIRETRSVEYAK